MLKTSAQTQKIPTPTHDLDNFFSKAQLYTRTVKLDHRTTERHLIKDGVKSVFKRNARGGKLSDYTVIVYRNSYRISILANSAHIENFSSSNTIETEIECPFSFLNDVLAAYKGSVKTESLKNKSPFQAGFIGYLGYGLTESSLSIPRQTKKFANLPDSIMDIPGCYLIVEAAKGSLTVVSDKDKAECDQIAKRIIALDSSTDNEDVFSLPIRNIKLAMKREDYLEKVAKTKEHIRKGNAFQIVLAQRFYLPIGDIAPSYLFANLLTRITNSSTPYIYYFDYTNFQYLGTSPESFININNRSVGFRALAGTRPRGSNPKEDKQMEKELLSCEKENAEHMMLVDLGRNDLGKISEPGSIKVERMRKIVKYPGIMHLSTDLKGLMDKNCHQFQAVKSCFPRGTVSGAPKKRALEILSQIEPEQRGIYSGCVGLFDINGNVDLAIAIRSAIIANSFAHVQAGAGIVNDSIAANEYLETENKAKTIIDLITQKEV